MCLSNFFIYALQLIERDTDVRLGSLYQSEDEKLCVAAIKYHNFFSSELITDTEKLNYHDLLACNSHQTSVRYKVTGAVRRFTSEYVVVVVVVCTHSIQCDL